MVDSWVDAQYPLPLPGGGSGWEILSRVLDNLHRVKGTTGCLQPVWAGPDRPARVRVRTRGTPFPLHPFGSNGLRRILVEIAEKSHYYPGTKETHGGRAFEPDSLAVAG